MCTRPGRPVWTYIYYKDTFSVAWLEKSFPCTTYNEEYFGLPILVSYSEKQSYVLDNTVWFMIR